MLRDNSRTLRAYGGGLVPTGFYCSKKFSPPSFGSRQHYHLLCPRFTFHFFHSRFFYILPDSLSSTFSLSFHIFPFLSHSPTKTQNIIFSSQPRQRQLITQFTTFHSLPILTSRTVMFYAHPFSPLFFLFYFLVSPAEFIERLFFVLSPAPFVCEPLYATGMNSTHTNCTAHAPYITPSYYSVIIIIIINIHRAHSTNRFKVEDYNVKKIPST